MEKNCTAQKVLDYPTNYTNYTINIDGQVKKIEFPGCKEELEEIEELIRTLYNKQWALSLKKTAVL